MTSKEAKQQRIADLIRQYRTDSVGFCRTFLDLEPHVGQQRWLQNSTNIENALVTGNRWGKSHIAAAKAIIKCCYRTGWNPEMRARLTKAHQPYHGINVALTADQSRLVWFKAKAMLESPKANWLVKDIKMTPFPRITFFNDAVFEARSTGGDGERLLGNVYDFVNWDEAAYEKKFEYVRDNVLRMRVVDRAGTIDYTSTGNGRNPFGLYFLSGLPGEKKDPDLYSQTGPTFENPNVDHERLEKNMRRMSERMRRQNIQGEIVDAGGGFFSIEDIDAAESDELTQLLRVLKTDDEEAVAHAELFVDELPWHSRYPSHRYVHFWDLANTTDWTVGITLDTSGEVLKLVEFERFQKTGWSYIYDRMRDRHYRYTVGDTGSGTNSKSQTYFDATGVGQTVAETLLDIRATGLVFTKPSKDEILTDLQSSLSLRQLQMPQILLVFDELKFYERDDNSLVQDCVMALAGAVHFGKRKKFYEALAI